MTQSAINGTRDRQHHGGRDRKRASDTNQPLELVAEDQSQPHNDEAERAVLGAMLLDPAAIDAALPYLLSGDFYRPHNEAVYAAVLGAAAAEGPTDQVSIGIALRRNGELERLPGGITYLHSLVATVPTRYDAENYAKEVAQHSRTRKLDVLAISLRLAAAIPDPEVRAAKIADLMVQIEEVRTGPAPRDRAQRIDEFMAVNDDEEHDWIIPGLLERTDRVILTGGEGSGKSTFGRQVGVSAAAGIHPFTFEDIPPIKVMIVDLENSEPQMRRELRPLTLKVRGRLDPANLYIKVRIEGLNLHSQADQVWLEQLVSDEKPDLLITGPIYKMGSGDPTEEKFAKPIADYFDKLRARYGVALWIEAHSAKAAAGGKRPIEPYGASLWLRWPEFGVNISKEGDLAHWRGQREAREWPTVMLRGGAWPWTPSHDELEMKWRQIKNARFSSGGPLTVREIEEKTRISKSTVQRVLKRYANEWAVFNARNPSEDDVA